jgi:hypothetical protein
VVPPLVADGNLVFPDWISQGSNTGFKRELCYHGMLSLFAEQGSILDFSNNRPIDSTGVGEWGKMSDLGGGIHVDPFYVFLRTNDNCGLFLHYLDDLARLEASNLDVRTAVSESIVRNDTGEGLIYKGSSPYAWEALGAFNRSAAVYREIPDEAVQLSAPYGKIEPLADSQQPFYRTEEYGGYLGQGWLRQVLLPPQQQTQLLTFNSNVALPGVFREQVGLEGSYGLQSAHSIVFAKRSLIPIGKRLKPADAPDGDNVDGEDNQYSFAGQTPGRPHVIGDIEVPEDESVSPWAAGLSDYLAHLFNWKGLHPFYYHDRDFFLPEQSQLSPLQTLQQPPSFGQLLEETWLQPPTPKQLRVDDRYGEVDYYETQSSFALLPDGSSVWRGGFGEEIRFINGSIQISCPGDILLQPGRSVVAYGGDDIILKANKSVDITANQSDVRVKAENNLELLGGNSGSGRTLIENKAFGFQHDYSAKVGEDIRGSGILLKSSTGQIVNWAAEIYLRTGGGDVTPGPIVLDADQGGQSISCIARDFTRHLEVVAADYFPAANGKQVANTYSAINAQIQTPCQFDGFVTITQGGMLMKGNLAILGGHLGTELADQFDFLVGWYQKQPLREANAALAETILNMEINAQAGNDHYQNAFVERFYGQEQVGEDTLIENAAFSLRNEAQYGTENWELPETYWQQMARESSQTTGTWADNPVEYQNNQYSAHPGYNRWREPTAWLTMDLSLHDPQTGRDQPLSSNSYEQSAFNSWQRMAADDNYPTISPQ